MNDHIVQPGALGWGIKDSFRGYLSRQADFSLNVDDGASVGAGNAVQFPLVEDRSEGVVWATRGHAVFRAHGGMMRLSLRNPKVTRSGADLVMAFDVGSEPQGAEPDHFAVARLVEVPSGDPRQRTYRAYLLPSATGMFNDMYDSDVEMDPVTVTTEAMS